MNDFSEILKVVGGYLDLVDGFIWGVPLLVMLLAVGVLLTIGLRGIQLSNLAKLGKLRVLRLFVPLLQVPSVREISSGWQLRSIWVALGLYFGCLSLLSLGWRPNMANVCSR